MTKFTKIANDLPATGTISTQLSKSPYLSKLSLQERLDFAREYAERLEWGCVFVRGPRSGTELDLNAANYAEMRRRYGFKLRTFKAYINAQCDLLQRNLDDGTASGLKEEPSTTSVLA